jgi:hypothetical protein
MNALMEQLQALLGWTFEEDGIFWNSVVDRLTRSDEQSLQDVRDAYNEYRQTYVNVSVSLTCFFCTLS